MVDVVESLGSHPLGMPASRSQSPTFVGVPSGQQLPQI
jgi:hypothetical protein